jgi:hypothetical protein
MTLSRRDSDMMIGTGSDSTDVRALASTGVLTPSSAVDGHAKTVKVASEQGF